MTSTGRNAPKATVVLGGGSALGGSFHAGVLRALAEVWGLDIRSVDSLIGTSSGAVVASLVGAGLDAEDLFRRELGQACTGPGALRLAAARQPVGERTFGPLARATATVPPGRQRDELRGAPRSLGSVAAAMLPAGGVPTTRLRRFVDALYAGSWPTHVRLQLCAVERSSGRRVVLDDTSPSTPGQAVAASCSIPGLHAPVRVEDRELVDGFVYSANNLDVAAGSPARTVVVSAPVSIDRRARWTVPLSPVRNAVRAQVAREARRLGADRDVIVLEPTPAVATAMGFDLGDRRRRSTVATMAYDSTCRALEARTAPPVVTV